jgi:hypothetical protein
LVSSSIISPAALLYPVALWVLNHTHLSEHSVINGYVIGIGVLFLPTGFLVDYLYRKFILSQRSKKPRGPSEPST